MAADLVSVPKAKLALWRWPFIIALAAIVFFGAIRWRLADEPLERDEGEYAYGGQLLLEGVPPYKLAYNMKLPGTSAAYAAMMAVFGQTGRGIHLGLILVDSVCAVLLYLIVARLFGTLAAAIAAASFAALSTNKAVFGFAAHATHFVIAFALAGILFALLAEETRRPWWFFGSGLAMGLAFLMKQPGIFLGAFAFTYLAIRTWPREIGGRRRWGSHIAAFVLGAALPFLLTCAWLYHAGVFGNFWFWTFSYAGNYANVTSFEAGMKNLQNTLRDVFRLAGGLWVLSGAGIFGALWSAAVRRHAIFVFGLLAFSAAAVCPGLYFRGHYFILLLPAVAILIGVAISSATVALGERRAPRWVQAAPVVVFAAAFSWAIFSNARFYFKLSPFEAARATYSFNPFPEAITVADYLGEHTSPEESIMVLGSEPEIYFDAHRRSASGYIYFYSLTEDQPDWQTMQRQMMKEVETGHPAYVVFVNINFSWLARRGSPQTDALTDWMRQYLANGFERVGMVDVALAGSHYYWGAEASQHEHSGHQLLIFKRKA